MIEFADIVMAVIIIVSCIGVVALEHYTKH